MKYLEEHLLKILEQDEMYEEGFQKSDRGRVKYLKKNCPRLLKSIHSLLGNMSLDDAKDFAEQAEDALS